MKFFVSFFQSGKNLSRGVQCNCSMNWSDISSSIYVLETTLLLSYSWMLCKIRNTRASSPIHLTFPDYRRFLSKSSFHVERPQRQQSALPGKKYICCCDWKIIADSFVKWIWKFRWHSTVAYKEYPQTSFSRAHLCKFLFMSIGRVKPSSRTFGTPWNTMLLMNRYRRKRPSMWGTWQVQNHVRGLVGQTSDV